MSVVGVTTLVLSEKRFVRDVQKDLIRDVYQYPALLVVQSEAPTENLGVTVSGVSTKFGKRVYIIQGKVYSESEDVR